MSNRSRRTLSVWLTFFRASQKLTYLLSFKVRMHPCDKIHHTIWSEKFHQVGTKTLLILLSHQRRLRTVVDGKKLKFQHVQIQTNNAHRRYDRTVSSCRVGSGRVGSGGVNWAVSRLSVSRCAGSCLIQNIMNNFAKTKILRKSTSRSLISSHHHDWV